MIYYYYNYKLGLYLKINFLKNENLVYKLTKLHLPLPKNLFVGEFSLLKNFFLGNKKKIDVKFDFSGLSNNFVKVLKLIIEIPYGKLVTYSSLSSKLGFNPRYVGYVCKNNPYPIFIPCHRIISKNGANFYQWGENTKVFIQNLERV